MQKVVKVFMSFLLLTVMILPCRAEDMLQIRGSDTMLNLIQKIVEVYVKKNPAQNIAITEGGSGTGISGLKNRTVDIANSSRDITNREIIDLQAKGVQPACIVVCRDCITIIVNKNNKIDKLTTEQLGAIYRGDIANWKDVGGDDLPITLYGRQSNSGTYYTFREKILNGEYADNTKKMNGNSQIVESIKEDTSGIGYVGRGYAMDNSDIKVVSIAARGSADYVNPLDLTDKDAHTYFITRALNQYIDGKPKGLTRDLLIFELSDEGQKICEEMGYFKPSEEEAKQNKQLLAD